MLICMTWFRKASEGSVCDRSPIFDADDSFVGVSKNVGIGYAGPAIRGLLTNFGKLFAWFFA